MQIHGHGTGFTVIELMVTISIATILLVTAVPSFREFTLAQRMKAAIGSLHNDLMMGRSEAVNFNTRVVACPGDPAEGCSGLSDWSSGWIVFADDNADRQFQQTEILVRHGQGFRDLHILGSAGRNDIRFFPDGSTPGSNGSISFCGPGGPEKARKLVVSNLGRIRRDTAEGINPGFCPM